jgi:hypothetical protein
MKEDMKGFLVKNLGGTKGDLLYKHTQERHRRLVVNISGYSDTQRNTLRRTIFPRIALFQVLKEDDDTRDRVEELLRSYMCDMVGVGLHRKIDLLEHIPFFFRIFSKAYLQNMRTSDLWESEIILEEPDRFGVNIYRCLWYDACVEHGYPELCRSFCQCDHVAFGSLQKLGFHRTQTLAEGGSCCGFCFFAKKGKT